MEEGSLSRTLALDCGHGYAREEYATMRERESGQVSGFFSLAVLEPRLGETIDVLTPFISVLCHSD